MRIQLFMEDATDDFGYAISSPTSDPKAGIYFARWLETKQARLQHDENESLTYKLQLRKESFGSLGGCLKSIKSYASLLSIARTIAA